MRRQKKKRELISRFNHCNKAVNMENYIMLAPLLPVVYISHKVIDRQFPGKVQRCRIWGSSLLGEGVSDTEGESWLLNCVRKKWFKWSCEKACGSPS